MAAISPAPKATQEVQELPIKMVGGVNYGRYPKISAETTINFIVSDSALVPYAGYKNVLKINASEGRGLYASSRGDIMLAVWGGGCWTITATGSTMVPTLTATFRGALATSTGDVFISENNNGEIAFTDGVHIYVYNYLTFTYQVSTTFTNFPAALTNPGYIAFQNGRLIVANTGSSNWYLSGANDATKWDTTATTSNHGYVGALQTKPDTVQAAVPTPGGGNNLLLFGHNVVEQWQDVGGALFPYQRSSTFNVDYGTVAASSIASMDDYIVWISMNESSGAALMVIQGGGARKISTDGIDYQLANLTNPTNCEGMLFRQDGHVIYQFTFPDDNLSFAYDFNTSLFFAVTDENLNYHIARNVVFFKNNYYFVSINGGNLYDFGTEFTDIDYGDGAIWEIPRIRITAPIRMPSQRMFILKSVGFTIENGQPNTIDSIGLSSENVDISISRDGGVSFGQSWRKAMNPIGVRRSRFIWQRLGQSNDVTLQFKFNGFGRFVVCDDGLAELYQ